MRKINLIALSITLWGNEFKAGLWFYQEPGWGFRKLGAGRVALDLGKLSVRLESYYFGWSLNA